MGKLGKKKKMHLVLHIKLSQLNNNIKVIQYQWFEIKFNLLGGLTKKILNIYLKFYQSCYTQTLPPKKFMTIAKINE